MACDKCGEDESKHNLSDARWSRFGCPIDEFGCFVYASLIFIGFIFALYSHAVLGEAR